PHRTPKGAHRDIPASAGATGPNGPSERKPRGESPAQKQSTTRPYQTATFARRNASGATAANATAPPIRRAACTGSDALKKSVAYNMSSSAPYAAKKSAVTRSGIAKPKATRTVERRPLSAAESIASRSRESRRPRAGAAPQAIARNSGSAFTDARRQSAAATPDQK